jgi:hypothetical protein
VVLIPKNVIYFYHEDHEGLEDIAVLTSCVILRRLIKHSTLIPVIQSRAFYELQSKNLISASLNDADLEPMLQAVVFSVL